MGRHPQTPQAGGEAVTFRQVAVQGGLALGALVFAYFTWQRSPELAADEVFVVDIGKNDLVSARWDDQEKSTWVELGRSSDESGPFITVRLGPQEQPTPAKTPAEGTKTEAKKTPERLVRGSDAAEKLFANFAPLHASRSLGILPAEKLKDLGLADAKKRITLVLRGGQRTFAIAPAPAGGSEPYLRDEQSGQVFLVARSFLSDFQAAASLLVERHVHTFRLEEADRIAVSQGSTRREFLVSRGEGGVRLSPASAPDKPDSSFKTWHDRVFGAWPVEVLGKDETPLEGAPQIELRIEYSLRGRRLGFIEIGKAADVATPSEGAKPPLFARSERSLGWFKLAADTLLADGQALLR
jgi:hypothetical protein